MPTIIFILNFCKLPWTQEQNKQTLIHHHEVRRIVQKICTAQALWFYCQQIVYLRFWPPFQNGNKLFHLYVSEPISNEKNFSSHSAQHITTINWSLSKKAPFILFALRLFLSTLHEIEGIETHQRWQHFAAENIRIIFPL